MSRSEPARRPSCPPGSRTKLTRGDSVGMDALLCTLSPKRLALIEDDPDVLTELIEARHEQQIPGLLDLGNTWHALDIMLGDGKDEVLADALVARNGKKMKAGATHGKARM